MRQLHISFTLLITFTFCVCDQRDARISALEERVGALEDQLSNMESDWIVKFGLLRRCPLPSLEHGKVKCQNDDIVPGTTCSAVCDLGYIATPTQTTTTCQKSGVWDISLRCEIPLLVVSGGTIDGQQTESSGVEVISFHNSSGCELEIPDMPGSRIMHNLVHVPHGPTLLTCNGLTHQPKTSCESWSIGDGRWKYHSNPHRKDIYQAEDLRGKGRYAASAFVKNKDVFIIGGMIHNTTNHRTTSTIRHLESTRWTRSFDIGENIKVARAFFCIAEWKGSFLAIGGYSGKIEKSVEKIGNTYRKVPDIMVPRSGHACTGLEGDQILVSGGSRTDGASAMADSELMNGETKQWEIVGEMVRMRFGHALVNVGGRIIALGGKERSPDVVMDSGEEFDLDTKSWKSIGSVLKKPRANFGYTLIPHSIIPGCQIN